MKTKIAAVLGAAALALTGCATGGNFDGYVHAECSPTVEKPEGKVTVCSSTEKPVPTETVTVPGPTVTQTVPGPTETVTVTPAPTPTQTPTPTATATTPAPPAAAACTRSGATGATGTTVTNVTATVNDTGDDTAAINSAINTRSAAGGGIVKLQAGTYIVGNSTKLVLKSNVRLEGVGPSTILKAGPNFLSNKSAAGGYPIVTTAGASNVTIANLTADHSGNTLAATINTSGRLSAYVIDVRDSVNSIVEGVSVRNQFTYAFVAVGGSKWCFRNNNSIVASSNKYNQLDGLHALNTHTGDFVSNNIDNRVGNDGDDAIAVHSMGNTPVHNIRVADNVVRGGSHGAGIDLASGVGQISNVEFTGNKVWGSTTAFHDAYYETGAPPVKNITVVGNRFENNSGASVDFEKPVTNVIVKDNTRCNSGTFNVPAGTGNVVENNTSDTNC